MFDNDVKEILPKKSKLTKNNPTSNEKETLEVLINKTDTVITKVVNEDANFIQNVRIYIQEAER